MFKSLKNNNAGFSIVEIMIVLVVVGLVTVGIILAGQTLSRNNRNNARDSDVRLIGQQIQDFAIANRGQLPDDIKVVGGGTGECNTDGTTITCDDGTTDTANITSPCSLNVTPSGGSCTFPSANFDVSLNLGYYNENNEQVGIDDSTATATAVSGKSHLFKRTTTNGNITTADNLPDVNNIHIWVGYVCPDSIADIEGTSGQYNGVANFGGTNVSTRSFIMVYQLEGSGGEPYRCVEYSSTSQ